MNGLNQIWAPISSSGFQLDLLQRRGKSVLYKGRHFMGLQGSYRN
jgi:hypothetical protein